MEENKNTQGKGESRRRFLKKLGLVAGAGAIAGGAAIYAVNPFKNKKHPEGKKEKVLTADGDLVEVSKSELQASRAAHSSDVDESLLNEYQSRGRKGIPGKKWVMVIDLSRCRNARMCMAACQSAHRLRPEQHHINVYRMQDSDNTAPYFMPKPCYHCDNPPCTKVCPVDATFKRQDGIVLIDNERCIGCRFCIAGCPYSARVFNWSAPKYKNEDESKIYDVELNVPQKKGTITKCLFSADRLREAKLPYCVSACPNGVYYFGDLNEDVVTNGTTKESVRFSDLVRKNAAYTVMEELGTKPQVYYLPAKNRLFPFNYNGKTTLENKDDKV